MDILNFRIKNYKSIQDSEECYLEKEVTILAGKNEAGKTAILEALEDFNSSKNIREEAKPYLFKEALPEIIIRFKLSKDEVNKILSDLGTSISLGKATEITFIKKYPNIYSLDNDSINSVHLDTESINKGVYKSITQKYKEIQVILNSFTDLFENLPKLIIEEFDSFKSALTEYKKTVEVSDFAEKQSEKDEVLKLINEIIGANPDEISNNLRASFIEEFKKYLPNFILFNSFDDILQSEITIEEARKNDLIKDLITISELNLDIVSSGSESEKIKHKSDLNLQFREEYEKYWSQDFTNLVFEWNGDKLLFFIKENEEYYPTEIRSAGKKWHLAFYIRMTARSQAGEKNIILVDEPGLYLHATAQKDILKKLENSGKTTPIIFSTHSPYLLDPKKLHRIRLVQRGVIPRIIEGEVANIGDKFKSFYEEKTHRDNSLYFKLKKQKDFTEEKQDKLRAVLFKMKHNIGTVVEQKIHKVADKETLTPILTAIGLELTSGIANIDKKNNVVVEGQSDVFYLQAFKLLISVENMNFIFGGGAGNMPIVGTILSGWGCDVLYLYDNDQGRRDAEVNLKNNWLVTKEYILSVVSGSSKAIEDVFTKTDFKKHILGDTDINYEGLNSEYLANSDKDKVLLAKLFLQKCEESPPTLSAGTKTNIEKVFNQLKSKFESEF